MKRAKRSATRRAGARENRRGTEKRSRRPRAVLDPEHRRVRNRTIVGLSLLGLLNLYVFGGSTEELQAVAALGPASIGGTRGPLPPLAAPRADTCGGDRVRTFDGLEDALHVETRLTGRSTLRLALLSFAVPADEIDRVEAAVRATLDLAWVGGRGAPLRVALDRDRRILALEIEPAEGHVVQTCRRAGQFEVRNLQHPVRTDVEVIALELGTDADLASAIARVGEKYELAHRIAETLAHDVDLISEVRPGDRIAVMIEKRWLGRSFHRYGEVLAIRFHGTSRRCTYVRYKPDGEPPAFYDGSGRPMRRSFLRSPIGYFPIASESRALLTPGIEVFEGQLGATYRVPEGAPVVALGDATVRAVDRSAHEGRFVDLDFGDGKVARYCHLSAVMGDIEPGSTVRQGQVVGLAGHTGRTPHDRLRLEIWVQDGDTVQTVDPLRAIADGSDRAPMVGGPLAQDQLERFKDATAPHLRALQLAGS